MKIISKYKDYYDYLMGIRGVDSLVVLDRRKGFVHKWIDIRPNEKYGRIDIAICGWMYSGIVTKVKGYRFVWGINNLLKFGKFDKSWRGELKGIRIEFAGLIPLGPKETDLNDKFKCPILYVEKLGGYAYLNNVGAQYNPKVLEYPKLGYYGVQKWYKAEDIYTDVSNWISKRNEKEIIDKRTDLEKIQNAGFDKITSFRNM